MVVSWYGKRKRKLRSLTVEVPFPMLERFLRGIKSPSPAIRQRRRNDRKGKDCKERRKLSRDRVADSVREQEMQALWMLLSWLVAGLAQMFAFLVILFLEI
jgi:hypothetical protein